MRFIGVSGGECKIIEDFDLEKIRKVVKDFQFAWLDIDGVSPDIENFVRDVFGIEEINQSGDTRVVGKGSYDLVFVNYYKDMLKHDVSMYFAENFLLTIHKGKDDICEEVMATINELLTMGEVNADIIIRRILGGVLAGNEEEILHTEKGLRKITIELEKKEAKPEDVFQLERSSRKRSTSVSKLQEAILSVISKTAGASFIHKPESFSDIFEKVNEQKRQSDELHDIIFDMSQNAIPLMWKTQERMKKTVGGLSIISTALAFSSILIASAGNLRSKLYGVEVVNIVIVLVFLGVVGFLLMQRSNKLDIL